jgi:hypothetical protein
MGDTVYALRHDFERLISIELDPELAAHARQRFKRHSNITILQGDSSVVLPELLSALHDPALFWLDAHWSGGITARAEIDTPVTREIEAILRHPFDCPVILIDDARYFGVDAGYPTLESVCEQVLRSRSSWICSVQDDVIRVHCPV